MIKPNFRHKIGDRLVATAVAQDYQTGEVLMVAFIDEEAYTKSIETGYVHYYSTSRKSVWYKGETSGHTQKIKEIFFDCDEDAIVFKVEQIGGACHTGHYSCFYTRLSPDSMTKTETQNMVFNPDEVY